jgi:hypothetical protein
MKRCSKCRLLKDVTQFPKNKLTSDHLGSWCKPCVAANSSAYFKTDHGREKMRQAQRRYFDSEKGKTALSRSYKRLQAAGYFRYGKGGFLILRQGAVKRGIDLTLTEAELEKWWIHTPDICVYCGTTIEDYRRLRDIILNYDGRSYEIRRFLKFYRSPKHKCIDWMTIDRADNDRGYELENIVKCCWICNSLKRDFYSSEEMYSLGSIVISRLKQTLISLENYNHHA